MSTRTYTPANVRRGEKLLDEHVPGWRRIVDINTLDLASCDACILGQVFGSYQRGMRALDVTNGAQYGFDRRKGQMYDTLTSAWARITKPRRPRA